MKQVTGPYRARFQYLSVQKVPHVSNSLSHFDVFLNSYFNRGLLCRRGNKSFNNDIQQQWSHQGVGESGQQ